MVTIHDRTCVRPSLKRRLNRAIKGCVAALSGWFSGAAAGAQRGICAATHYGGGSERVGAAAMVSAILLCVSRGRRNACDAIYL